MINRTNQKNKTMKKTVLAAMVAAAAMTVACGGGASTSSEIIKGDSSKFDSLSYALGVNVADMFHTQLSDIPLDIDVVLKSIEQTAYGKNTVDHAVAVDSLRSFFMTKRNVRMAEIEAKRDENDSIALANGADSATVAAARAALGADEAMFESTAERTLISEAFGIDVGTNLVGLKAPVQLVWINAAFNDVFGGEPKMDGASSNAYLQNYFTVVVPAKNLEASKAWLAEIEKESGVQKTESGILYKIETAGDDSVIAVDDRDQVKVIYTGKTRDGKVFDSSRWADMEQARKDYVKENDPDKFEQDSEIEFPLNRVIPGWTEGMKLVGKGGRISLWIPSELAYGERGNRGIGGNEALYFDVEVVDVIPYVDPAEAPAAE